MDILNIIFQQAFHDQSSWEIIAVILGIAYLVLAMRQSLWCWPCALVSTSIYTGLFWHVSLLMDSLLNGYYILMAVYGYWVWQRKKTTENGIDEVYVPITTWSVSVHTMVIVSVIVLSVLSGLLLDRFTQAAWPFLDSFTTWGSVVTTYMVAKKVLENWVYWFVIDAISVALYIERGLYFTALLFAVYVVMVVFGFFKWLPLYRQHQERKVSSSESLVLNPSIHSEEKL